MTAQDERRGGARLWKQPPLAKIYEAFSAVAAGRVEMKGPRRASVTSSNGARTYDVRWSEDVSAIVSDDNGSRWQGYAGYPIVAVLLVLGRLRADPALMAPLAGVDWHALNKRFKRKYDDAVTHALGEAALAGADAGAITQEAERVAVRLDDLHLVRYGGDKASADRA